MRPYIAEEVKERVVPLFTQFGPDKVQAEEEVVKTLYCTIQQRLGCGFQTELSIYNRYIKNVIIRV